MVPKIYDQLRCSLGVVTPTREIIPFCMHEITHKKPTNAFV